MIRFLIDTTVSKRDINGNCYNFSVVTSTKTGKHLVIDSGWGSSGDNVWALLRKAGLDWAELKYCERVIGIRDFNHSKPDHEIIHEHEATGEILLSLEGA